MLAKVFIRYRTGFYIYTVHCTLLLLDNFVACTKQVETKKTARKALTFDQSSYLIVYGITFVIPADSTHMATVVC